MTRILHGVCCMAVSLGVLWMSGCQNSDAYTTAEKDSVALDKVWNEDTLRGEHAHTAICVWPVVGLRREPGKNNYTSDRQQNYLVPIYYGERVEMLGAYDTLEAENRVYMKIRLLDGEEGWVYEELFEKGGRLAVIISESELYRRPDLMTLRNEGLEIGEIVIVLERKGEWVHISGEKKARKGWVQNTDIFSFREDDLKTALLYYKATEESGAGSVKETITRLEEILADAELTKSALIPLVQAKISQLKEDTQPPDSSGG